MQVKVSFCSGHTQSSQPIHGQLALAQRNWGFVQLDHTCIAHSEQVPYWGARSIFHCSTISQSERGRGVTWKRKRREINGVGAADFGARELTAASHNLYHSRSLGIS